MRIARLFLIVFVSTLIWPFLGCNEPNNNATAILAISKQYVLYLQREQAFTNGNGTSFFVVDSFKQTPVNSNEALVEMVLNDTTKATNQFGTKYSTLQLRLKQIDNEWCIIAKRMLNPNINDEWEALIVPARLYGITKTMENLPSLPNEAAVFKNMVILNEAPIQNSPQNIVQSKHTEQPVTPKLQAQEAAADEVVVGNRYWPINNQVTLYAEPNLSSAQQLVDITMSVYPKQITNGFAYIKGDTTNIGGPFAGWVPTNALQVPED